MVLLSLKISLPRPLVVNGINSTIAVGHNMDSLEGE